MSHIAIAIISIALIAFLALAVAAMKAERIADAVENWAFRRRHGDM